MAQNKDKELVCTWIKDFITDYEKTHTLETQWREPVIGFASAQDPLYRDLKTIIGPNHALPEEIVPGAKSVIVYFVPFAESIVKSNIPGEESSREWDIAYIDTNQMLAELSTYLHDKIEAQGFKASDLPPTYNYDEKLLLSDWSHRSSAYIAGIGTFGVNHMIITKMGCCGRIGSVITEWELEADKRPDTEYCLYKQNGTCGACMKRCVNHAFYDKDGEPFYDKYLCNEQIFDKIVIQYPNGAGDACGKCMVNVPCAVKLPGKQG